LTGVEVVCWTIIPHFHKWKHGYKATAGVWTGLA
jgi:hypothetical protein